MSEKVRARRNTPAMAEYRAKLERLIPGITKLPKAESAQAPCDLSTMPDFIKDDIGKGVEHIQDQDCVWYVGIEGAEVTSKLEADPSWAHGYEIRPLIESILWAILTANHQPHDAAGELITTLNALGITKQGPGRPKSVDDVYLREIAIHARRYMFDNKTDTFPLDTCIKQAIADRVTAGLDNAPLSDSRMKRLRMNFKKDRIKLLSAIGTEDLESRGPQLDAAKRILSSLEFPGVPVTRAHLGPEWKGTDDRQEK